MRQGIDLVGGCGDAVAEDVLPLSEPALNAVLVVVASSEGPFSFEAIMPSKLLTKIRRDGG